MFNDCSITVREYYTGGEWLYYAAYWFAFRNQVSTSAQNCP